MNTIAHSKIQSPIHTILLATIGTVLEWAEYTFFAYMADQLSTLFFSIENPLLAQLKTYCVFATSYFMRPLGAYLFGTFGDKYGRKQAFMYSLLLMGIATVAIGCLPTYSQVGILAPLLLILCRLLQGLALSGEFNGAALYIFEQTYHRPCFAGAFAPAAAAFGMALGAFAAYLTIASTSHFAWRVPFLLSGVICVLALYLRVKISDTEAFITARTQGKLVANPLVTVLQENKMGLILTAAFSLFIAVFVYIGNIYYKTMAIKIGLIDPVIASKIATMGQLLSATLILACGFLGDYIGGKKLCMGGLLLALFTAPMMMNCAQSGDVTMTWMGQVLYSIINGLVSGSMMPLMLRQFTTETRYTGSSLAWSVPAAIFGGTALLLAETLVSVFALPQGPGFYIATCAGVALAVVSGVRSGVFITNITKKGQIAS